MSDSQINPSDRPEASPAAWPDGRALQDAVEELKRAARSVSEIRPHDLFAEIDRRVGDLTEFRRNMEPVKTAVDDLLRAVGGRDGYAVLVDRVAVLSRRVIYLTVSVIVMAAALITTVVVS